MLWLCSGGNHRFLRSASPLKSASRSSIIMPALLSGNAARLLESNTYRTNSVKHACLPSQGDARRPRPTRPPWGVRGDQGFVAPPPEPNSYHHHLISPQHPNRGRR